MNKFARSSWKRKNIRTFKLISLDENKPETAEFSLFLSGSTKHKICLPQIYYRCKVETQTSIFVHVCKKTFSISQKLLHIFQTYTCGNDGWTFFESIYSYWGYKNCRLLCKFVKVKIFFIFELLKHYKCTVTKIRNKYSYKWNCAALYPISIFMFLWAICIVPWTVCKRNAAK